MRIQWRRRDRSKTRPTPKNVRVQINNYYLVTQNTQTIKSRSKDLVVVAVKTSGVWCGEGRKWMYAIRKKFIEKSGQNKARSYLIQRHYGNTTKKLIEMRQVALPGNATCLMSAITSREGVGKYILFIVLYI